MRLNKRSKKLYDKLNINNIHLDVLLLTLNLSKPEYVYRCLLYGNYLKRNSFALWTLIIKHFFYAHQSFFNSLTKSERFLNATNLIKNFVNIGVLANFLITVLSELFLLDMWKKMLSSPQKI